MADDGNFHVIEPLDARPLRGRRGWSAEAKARLVAESLAPGANVSAIARREDMAASQLFGWRRKALLPGQVGVAAQGQTETTLHFARVEMEPGGGMVEVVVIAFGLWPPIWPGATLPVLRSRFTQPIAVLIPIPNCLAA
jgi:transposase